MMYKILLVLVVYMYILLSTTGNIQLVVEDAVEPTCKLGKRASNGTRCRTQTGNDDVISAVPNNSVGRR